MESIMAGMDFLDRGIGKEPNVGGATLGGGGDL